MEVWGEHGVMETDMNARFDSEASQMYTTLCVAHYLAAQAFPFISVSFSLPPSPSFACLHWHSSM